MNYLRICEKISWTISAQDFLSATRRRTHTGCYLARTTTKLRAKNPAIMFIGTSENSLSQHHGDLHWSFFTKILVNTQSIASDFCAKAPSQFVKIGFTNPAPRWCGKQFSEVPLSF